MTLIDPTVEHDLPAPALPAPVVVGPAPRLQSTPRGLPPWERSPVPDLEVDAADLDTVRVRGCSSRGDEHRYYGETRQDAMALAALTLDTGRFLVTAVADGVGSRPGSHLVARQAVTALPDQLGPVLPDLFNEPTPGETVGWLTARLSERVDGRHGASTLTFAVRDLADEKRRWLVARVGDSPAYVLRADGDWHDLFTEKPVAEQRYVAATAALPNHPDAVEVREVAMAPGEVLVLCTDGLGGPLRRNDVREHLARSWSDVPTALEFAWQLSFRVKSFADDRTAVCAWEV